MNQQVQFGHVRTDQIGQSVRTSSDKSIRTTYGFLAAELLSALHTLVLVLLGLVKRSLWDPLLRALRIPALLHRIV
jgi:hypothetical protein